MRELSIEEIEEIAASFKEDLTRECERSVRRGDNSAALSALNGKEYIDKFLYTLKMNAVSGLKEYLSRPARARPIRINKALKAK